MCRPYPTKQSLLMGRALGGTSRAGAFLATSSNELCRTIVK